MMLLACGEDESEPNDEGSDAGSEGDAGGEDEDAGSERDAGGEDAGSEAGEPQAAGLVLSGALTATFDNVVPSSSWGKANAQSSLIHLPTGGGEVTAFFTFTFAGPPEQGETYDEKRSGLSCALTATRASDGATWDAVHDIPGTTDQGSCSFTLTSVSETLDLETLKQFEVHGTLEGTLPPKEGSGAQGTVTMRAKF